MKMSQMAWIRWGLVVLLLAVPACLGAAGGADVDVDETDVVVLTESNFKDELNKAKYALVEFYAPWCGHCKSLKPAYAAAATKLKAADGVDAILAKVDATQEKTLADQFGVRGYPTLKWFVGGELVGDYSGGRSESDIVAWVTKKTGPATRDLADVAALEKAEADEGVYAIAYLAELSGPAFESFVAQAEKDDSATYLTTTSEAVAAALGLTAPGSAAVVRHYADTGVERVAGAGLPEFEATEGEFGDKVAALVLAQRLPAYLEFSQQNAPTIFGSGVPKQVIVCAPESAWGRESALEKALAQASATTRGKVVLVTAKLGTPNADPIAKFFGVEAGAEEPFVVGFDSGSNKKFSFPEGAKPDAEGIAAFAQSIVDGTAQGLLKSAPVPDEPTDNGVTVVVGKTVEDIVFDTERDVLLEVYAPWCGHCKALAPTYEKLAKKFAGVDSVVIAKMDGTENEHPEISAQGFPTLLFFPAGSDRTPVPYQDERTLKAFTKFLKTNAVKKFQLPKKGDKKKGKAATGESHEEL